MKKSNVPKQDLCLSLLDVHAVLATGTNIQRLYQAAATSHTMLKQIHGFYGQDGARLIAAPVPDYEHYHLRERLEDIFLCHLSPFIKKSASSTPFIHVHCSDPGSPQAAVINQSYLQLLFEEYFPGCLLYFSYGHYLKGLIEAQKQGRDFGEEWISCAIDCQCDSRSLQALNQKNHCMTSLNDLPPAPGEAYLFFYVSNKIRGQKWIKIMAVDSESLHQTKPQALIYPALRNVSNIEHLLKIQRQLWPKQPELKTISPYTVCGDTGAASEALCLILAMAASPQSLVLTEHQLAALIQTKEEKTHE